LRGKDESLQINLKKKEFKKAYDVYVRINGASFIYIIPYWKGLEFAQPDVQSLCQVEHGNLKRTITMAPGSLPLHCIFVL
jgi:hypothetical protein